MADDAHTSLALRAGRRKAAAHHPDRELVALEERDEERDGNHEQQLDCEQQSEIRRQFSA